MSDLEIALACFMWGLSGFLMAWGKQQRKIDALRMDNASLKTIMKWVEKP